MFLRKKSPSVFEKVIRVVVGFGLFYLGLVYIPLIVGPSLRGLGLNQQQSQLLSGELCFRGICNLGFEFGGALIYREPNDASLAGMFVVYLGRGLFHFTRWRYRVNDEQSHDCPDVPPRDSIEAQSESIRKYPPSVHERVLEFGLAFFFLCLAVAIDFGLGVILIGFALVYFARQPDREKKDELYDYPCVPTPPRYYPPEEGEELTYDSQIP